MQDATLRFYVLTSRNLKCLKRHFHSLSKDRTTVVINSLNELFVERASLWCANNDIHFIITESNGNPGKGKNSCLDHFIKTEESHMLLIDGDDFVQPHGVNLYSWIAQKNEVDGIQIVHSKSWGGGIRMKDMYAPAPWTNLYKRWGSKQIKEFPHMKDTLVEQYKKSRWYHQLYLIHLAQNKKWNYPQDSLNSQDCARLILWNRKLAKMLRFDENLLIGEDTLLNFEARELAYTGKIKLKKVLDRQELTYFYDMTNSGIVKQQQNAIDWDWMEPLNRAIEAREPYWTVPETYALEEVQYDFEKIKPLDMKKLL